MVFRETLILLHCHCLAPSTGLERTASNYTQIIVTQGERRAQTKDSQLHPFIGKHKSNVWRHAAFQSRLFFHAVNVHSGWLSGLKSPKTYFHNQLHIMSNEDLKNSMSMFWLFHMIDFYFSLFYLSLEIFKSKSDNSLELFWFVIWSQSI